MIGFYLYKKGILAFGLANIKDSGFIVCAGSNIRNRQAGNMSMYRKKAFALRARLLRDGVISKNLVFLKNYEFKNISEASSVILGGSRSGDGWINANGQSYPRWANPKRQKLFVGFKRGSRFITNHNERFLVMDVVENLDENNNKIYEYLLRPEAGGEDVLVPEEAVIRSFKRLIDKQIAMRSV